MNKKGNLITTIGLLVCFVSMADACQYNVRDVGFVDLHGEPYALYCFVDNAVLEDISDAYREVTTAGFMDSNIVPVLINVEKNKSHPAVKYIQKLDVRSYPAFIFASPNGSTMVPLVLDRDKPFKDQLWSLVDRLVTSDKREEILDKLAENFAVVLVVEGENKDENRDAFDQATAAVKHIASQMTLMPKLVSSPPTVVVIDRATAKKESILLWSYGIDVEKTAKPVAAVMYGRGRMIGDALKYERADKDTLVKLLSIIGADCECGLDRKWMEGQMMPMKWDEDLQQKAAKNLGFDPENPSVKMEISLILKKGPNEQAISRDPDAIPPVSFGYQEIEVVFDRPGGDERPVVNPRVVAPRVEPIEKKEPNLPAVPEIPEVPMVDSTVPAVAEADAAVEVEERISFKDPSVRMAIIITLIVVLVVNGAGIVFILRGRRNRR